MRLFSSKVPIIAQELVKKLVTENDLDVTTPLEVQRDVEAVLNEFIRLEREVLAKTKELVDSRKLPPSEFGRVKKSVAEQRGLKVGDEVIDYLLDQLVECFLYSNNVEEVFAADLDLRRKMAPVLKRHMSVDDDLDKEVRARLKHVVEGTPSWEIEYAKALELVKRSKGIQ